MYRAVAQNDRPIFLKCLGLNRVWFGVGLLVTAANKDSRRPVCGPKVPLSHLDNDSQGRIDDPGAPDSK
jgi:hypothetical protein